MAEYGFTLVYGVNGALSYPLAEVNTATYKCSNEDYIEDPKIRMVYRYTDTGGSPKYGYVAEIADAITRTSVNENYGRRCAFALDKLTSDGRLRCFDTPLLNSDWGRYHVQYGNSLDNPDPTMPNEANGSNFPNTGSYLIRWDNYRVTSVYTWVLSTNIPVFETSAEATAYITSGSAADLKKAVNFDYDVIEEGEDFLINNVWTTGTWSDYGLSNQGSINYRLLKGKLLEGSKMSFYVIPGISDGALKYGISVSGNVTALQYSDDGVNWHNSDSMPYAFFYREHNNERGTFAFGLSFFSQIPVFEDQETADKYVEDDPSVTINDAINWPQISGKYPINNTTGSSLPASVFGDVKLKGFFSQQYICDSTCLSALANDLFDTSQGGIWELMKKGMDMYQGSMDAVMGLSFWPFDVTSFVGAGNYSPANYIWLGGYGWDTSGHGTCNQIIYASGYKDIGTLRVMPTFNSWRDYEPYTKLYVSIPYCGTYQLDIARYIGKDIRFRYFIDTRTNGCICALIADGYLMDYFNGQMGVTMPIVLTDYSAFMNSQMQVLLQGGGQAMSDAMSSYGNAQGVASIGGAGGLVGGLIAGGLPAAMGGAVTGAKTVYGLAQNNINNFNKTKGGSSSMINCYLPQTIDLIFEIQESCEPANYNEMFGAPSLASGIVGNFTGFLKCQSVKVNAGKATEREKERIKQMLLSGIYI